MDKADFDLLKGFYDRQFTLFAYPLLTITDDGANNVPVRMTFSGQNIIDNCGTIQEVTGSVSARQDRMQTVSTRFNSLANGDVRPFTWGTQISFTKAYDDNVTFFTYDVSAYNGPDVYAPVNDNPLQAWDKYAYSAFGERVIDMSVTREFTFPYSIVSAIADFTLNNYDKYFTPHSSLANPTVHTP